MKNYMKPVVEEIVFTTEEIATTSTVSSEYNDGDL